MQSTLPEDNVTAATAVIRTGSDGRLRFDLRHREALLEAFQASGQTAMAFARQHGVKYQTFIAWQRKRREAAARRSPRGPRSPRCVSMRAGLPLRPHCGSFFRVAR